MTQAATLAGLASSGALSADTNGNVGIGTTSPTSKLTGIGNAGFYRSTGTSAGDPLGAQIYLGDSNFNNVSYFNSAPGIGAVFSAPDSVAGALGFYTFSGAVNSRAERARITSAGNFIVGSANLPSSSNKARAITPDYMWSSAGAQTTSYIHFYFTNGNGDVGTISTSGSGTSYTTTSDYRLKEDVQPMTGALAKVAALRPVTYKWKSDGSDSEGFIAHELQEVCPDAVVGEKDAVNEDGSIKPQGIDTSFLVATLTAAIQELKAELDATKAEVALLKGAA
jgi:hypothetical protein